MRIVIATPLYPPQVGGPATYAAHLEEEFKKKGHKARVVAYGRMEHALPIGVRHLWYLLRLLLAMVGSDGIIALDTWSVGVPALAAARIFGRRLAVRIGGDFLWESYVARTHELIPLSQFYTSQLELTRKEQFIRAGTRYLVRHADTLAFTTRWQCDLWHTAYAFPLGRAVIIENQFSADSSRASDAPTGTHKTFVAAFRENPLKQPELLARAFARVTREHPDIELDTELLPPEAHVKRLEKSYAVIVPSISEVNPNMLADAVAAGRPFIAPKDTGALERLGALGLFVDTTDEAALAEAIRKLLDPARYEALVRNIHAFTYARPWGTVADDFLNLFR